MEKIKSTEDFSLLKNNDARGSLPQLINSEIIFEGVGNIIYCQDNVTLKNVVIRFFGSNSIVFLSSSKHAYTFTANIFNNSLLFFGEDNYFSPHGKNMHLILSEGKNIFFGNGCLLSVGISIRLADPHLIYDVSTKERINFSKSVYIGDHVWIGQDVLLLKGTQIGSGSIIGANSVIANKIIHSNSSWAGNPAKLIRSGVFYSGECVHQWSSVESKKFSMKDSDEHIYSFDRDTAKNFDLIEETLSSINDAKNKLGYIIANICAHKYKNRFFVAT